MLGEPGASSQRLEEVTVLRSIPRRTNSGPRCQPGPTLCGTIGIPQRPPSEPACAVGVTHRSNRPGRRRGLILAGPCPNFNRLKDLNERPSLPMAQTRLPSLHGPFRNSKAFNGLKRCKKSHTSVNNAKLAHRPASSAKPFRVAWDSSAVDGWGCTAGRRRSCAARPVSSNEVNFCTSRVPHTRRTLRRCHPAAKKWLPTECFSLLLPTFSEFCKFAIATSYPVLVGSG
jgi:hypothetical protein